MAEGRADERRAWPPRSSHPPAAAAGPGRRRRVLLRSAAPAQSRSCAGGYTYAGRLSATPAHGVRATLTALSKPEVAAGHVAAWVGVGGVGQGVDGTDAWIQVGLSAFPGSESRLYYEVARPGMPPA